MKNHRIYELLSTFTRDEFKGFEKFSSSVYFNKGRDYSPILRELRKFHPEFSDVKLDNKYLYSRLYPGRKYNDQVIRNLFAGLTRIANEYLVYKTTMRSKTDYYVLLANEFLNRGLYRFAEKNLGFGREELSKTGKDKGHFRLLFELDRIGREIGYARNEPKSSIQTLSTESSDFIHYALMEISRHVEEMMVLHHNFNANFSEHILFKFIDCFDNDKLLEYLRADSSRDSGLLELYICNVRLQIDYRNEKLFEEFLTLLRKNFEQLSRWGKYNLYLCAQNACIRLQAVNEEKYSRILLDIYTEQLEAGLYNVSEGSPLSQDIFRNIIINALKLKEYNWTERFIDRYIGKLSPATKENMYNFSLSLLNFEKKNFETALTYVNKVKYDAFVFKYDIKVQLLKIYHELNYTEQELSMLDSFSHFIHENVSVSEFIKNIHLKFIKYLNDIIRARNKVRTFNSQKLKNEIAASNVRSKEWLLEKIYELTA